MKKNEKILKVIKKGERQDKGVNWEKVFQLIFLLALGYYIFFYGNLKKSKNVKKGAALYKPPTYHNIFNFDDVVFDSDFESGNLKFVRLVKIS